MSEWLELTDYYNNNQILIRKSAVTSVNKINEKKTVICALGDGKNFYVVKENYDEVKKMLMRQDVIEIKYNDEDKEQIQKWIEKLSSIGCQSFKVTPDPYQPTGAYTEEDFSKILKNLGL